MRHVRRIHYAIAVTLHDSIGSRARAVNASVHERLFPHTVKRLLVLQTEEATRWGVLVAVKLLAPQYVRVTCFHAAGSSAAVENQVSSWLHDLHDQSEGKVTRSILQGFPGGIPVAMRIPVAQPTRGHWQGTMDKTCCALPLPLLIITPSDCASWSLPDKSRLRSAWHPPS